MPTIVCELYGFKKEMLITEVKLKAYASGGVKLKVPIELSVLAGNISTPVIDVIRTDYLSFEYGGYVEAEDKHYFHLDSRLKDKILNIMRDGMCEEHDYVIKDIVYSSREEGYRARTYRCLTTYFCRKCLEEVEKIKETNSQELPLWYKQFPEQR